MRALAPRIGRLEARLAARAQASGNGICPVSASLRYLSDADLATVERLLDRFCADPADPEARAAVQAFATWADRHAPILANPGPSAAAHAELAAILAPHRAEAGDGATRLPARRGDRQRPDPW